MFNSFVLGYQLFHTIEDSDKLMESRGHFEQKGGSGIPKTLMLCSSVIRTYSQISSFPIGHFIALYLYLYILTVSLYVGTSWVN